MIDEQRTSDLLEAAGRIEAVFSPLAGRANRNEDIAAAEMRARSALHSVYRSLFAMARTVLLDHVMVTTGILPGLIHISIDEMAHETAEIPFEKRKDDGLLEIVHLLLGLFHDGSPRGRDVFMYLAGVTRRNVRQTVKRTFRLEDGLRSYVHGAVRSHVSNSPRYGMEGGMVVDLESGAGRIPAEPDVESVITSFDHPGSGSMSPGELVDALFDRIASAGEEGDRLSLSALRRIVYSKYRGTAPRDEVRRNPVDPEQEYLKKELLRIAGDSARRTVERYGWKEFHTGKVREAFERAGYDYLAEIIEEGTVSSSHYELIGRHLPGCGSDEYRKVYRGSFQHFLGLVWNDFIENFRAGPAGFSIERGEKSAR